MSLDPLGRGTPPPKRAYASESEAEEVVPHQQRVDIRLQEVMGSAYRRLQEIDQTYADKINRFVRDFDPLEGLIRKLCMLAQRSAEIEEKKDPFSSSSDSEAIEQVAAKKVKAAPLEEQFSDLEDMDSSELSHERDRVDDQIEEIGKKLDIEVARLVSQYGSEIGIRKEHFDEILLLYRSKAFNKDFTLQFLKEQMISRLISQFRYKNEMKANIERNKGEILAKFHCDISPQEVDFKIELHGSETHNGGKVAAKVTFYTKLGHPLFSVFYKPRKADIDARIIDFFARINALPENKTQMQLPTYSIFAFEGADGPFSIWEYIDDTMPNEAQHCAENFISYNAPSSDRDRLSKLLLRLETVCRSLGISDLHQENVLFQHLGSDQARIVPIDLESLQSGNPTGLYQSPPQLQSLSREEFSMIEEMKKILGVQVYFRSLPIPTGELLGALGRSDSFMDIRQELCEVFRRDGYQLQMLELNLDQLLLADFYRGDVPYFTQLGGNIYYGPVEKGIIVASRGQ